MSRFSLIFDADKNAAANLFGASLEPVAPAHRYSRYNISRGQHIIVLRADAAKNIAACTMLWGFTPHWIHCANPALQPLTVADAKVAQPYFRDAFQQRRCLIPASGFYAWQGWENGPAAPCYVQMQDRQPFLMAAIWDTCEGVDRVAMITTPANAALQPIHDRMPAIIPLAQAGAWLNSEHHPQQLLRPYPAATMEIYQVSRKLFSADSEGAALIERVAVDAPIARARA